jgi:DNA repair protein RadA/Sms
VKQKTIFKCTNCSYQPPKWVGCCPSCEEWDSIVGTEHLSSTKKQSTIPSKLVTLNQVSLKVTQRLSSGIQEWDRVVGGGIMPGSFLILTGDPGIGKSTLLLQIAERLARHYRVFYFSSEESLEQVKVRAQRLGCLESSLLFSDQANLETVITTAQTAKPALMVVDSIQNCYTAGAQTLPGTIGQLREAAFQLMRLAKDHNIALIVSGHITKDGDIAGPKLLEHMVDGVFYLQGEDRWQTRVLRSVKNRFGNINELGFFQMHETGLQEVPNINQELLTTATFAPGSVLISSLEGSRPLLLELQALTIASKFGIPQRVVTGIDQKRVVLISAILEKYLHINFSAHDIFFKVSGGFKIKESATDLGIALALLSSYFAKSLPEKSIALGEISLTGQIKPVNYMGIHIQEAHNFGIQQLFVAKTQKIDKPLVNVIRLQNVYELLSLFGD